VKVIATLDPENIKAILATQFNEFGKGDEFCKQWELVTHSSIDLICCFLGEVFSVWTERLGPILVPYFVHNS
jgi:hypothetical protein